MSKLKLPVGVALLIGITAVVWEYIHHGSAEHGHSHGPAITSEESTKRHDSLTVSKEDLKSHGHSH